MKEFIINDYIKLKLENNITFIYVNNEVFFHCKYILLEFPVEEAEDLSEIGSIDEAAERLDHSLEQATRKNTKIPPETEFWGHSSNLQAWAESGYDTRLLHSNLSFPLLKVLTESGDPQAKRVFKEEIAKRLMQGHLPVTTYLIEEGYLFFLNKDELETLLDSNVFSEIEPDDKGAWENLGYIYNVCGEFDKAIKAYKRVMVIDSDNIQILLQLGSIYRKKGDYNNAINVYKQALNINHNNSTIWRDFDKFLEEPYFLYLFLEEMPEPFKIPLLSRLIAGNNINPNPTISKLLSSELKELNILHVMHKGKIIEIKELQLSLSNQNIEEITDIINLDKHKDLKYINLYFNQISEIKGLENLIKLEHLSLNSNKISHIKGLETLKNLIKLDLKNNLITEIKGIEKLQNLEYLNLPKNQISEIKGLDSLTNLKQLVLNFNQIIDINGLDKLNNLEILDLRHNKISEIKNIKNLTKLKELYLSDNQITEIKELETLKNLEILDLSNNKITKVPETLALLPSLKTINLINCNIEDSPISLSERIINYNREDINHDIELFEKNNNSKALLGGIPTDAFRNWLNQKNRK